MSFDILANPRINQSCERLVQTLIFKRNIVKSELIFEPIPKGNFSHEFFNLVQQPCTNITI